MIEEEFDWNKHMKIFTNEVSVKVKSNVTRQDVLLSLLNEGEIAYKSKEGGHFILQITERWDFKTLKTLVWDSIREDLNKAKSEATK